MKPVPPNVNNHERIVTPTQDLVGAAHSVASNANASTPRESKTRDPRAPRRDKHLELAVETRFPRVSEIERARDESLETSRLPRQRHARTWLSCPLPLCSRFSFFRFLLRSVSLPLRREPPPLFFYRVKLLYVAANILNRRPYVRLWSHAPRKSRRYAK